MRGARGARGARCARCAVRAVRGARGARCTRCAVHAMRGVGWSARAHTCLFCSLVRPCSAMTDAPAPSSRAHSSIDAGSDGSNRSFAVTGTVRLVASFSTRATITSGSLRRKAPYRPFRAMPCGLRGRRAQGPRPHTHTHTHTHRERERESGVSAQRVSTAVSAHRVRTTRSRDERSVYRALVRAEPEDTEGLGSGRRRASGCPVGCALAVVRPTR